MSMVSNLRISTRLAAGFLLVLALTSTIGIVGLNSADKLADITVGLHDHPFTVIQNAGNARAAWRSVRIASRDLILATTPQEIAAAEADIEQNSKIYLTGMAIAREAFLGDKGKFDDSLAAFTAFRAATDEIALKVKAGDHEGALTVLRTKAFTAAQAGAVANEAISDFSSKKAQAFMVTAGEAKTEVQQLSLGLLIASLLIGAIIAFLTSRSITKPLVAITGTMTELADENLSVTVPFSDCRNEIGTMAKAVESFRLGLVEAARLRREAEAAKLREATAAEEVRRGNETRAVEKQRQDQQAADSQRTVVEALAGGLRSLSAGEVSYRITTQLPAGYERMKDDFNTAMDRLEDVANKIHDAISSIATASSEIAEGSDDLAQRTERQASSIEETAAAMEQLTATTKNNATNATEATAAASATQRTAEIGGREVTDAVAAMDQIAQSSRKISDIVGLIDEIAFQTNLLALNAAVEAARAGDAGKGFAVVATEVRSLAQRCGEASKEIKRLIIESNQHVNKGVHLVGSTGQTLAGIIGDVNRVADLMASIATASKEQSLGIEQVNSAVMQMEQTTQQNAALVEQSAASARTLEDQGRFLTTLIGFFKTRRIG